MEIAVTIRDAKMRRYLRMLQARSPKVIGTIAQTLAAIGREYARDIITVLIYATPERSGYRRTRNLIRSIYSAAEQTGSSWRILVGAGAGYAAYNELGTYKGYYGDDWESLVDEARQVAIAQQLVIMEYGRPESGLEPRPFIVPAIVMLERDAGPMIAEAVRRMMRDG